MKRTRPGRMWADGARVRAELGAEMRRGSCYGETMARARGFTLVELMVVVVLVGILASVGISYFRSEVAASKTSEAAAVIQAIRAAEEAYRAENQAYLDVSTDGAWYPSGSFGRTVRTWEQKPGAHVDLARWQLLGPRVIQPVMFGYLVYAGAPGIKPSKTMFLSSSPDFGTPTAPWYIIQARADADSNSVYCNAAATSFSTDVYFEGEGE